MRLSARQRWLLYLLAAVATGLAIEGGDDGSADEVVLPVTRSGAAVLPMSEATSPSQPERALHGGPRLMVLNPRAVEAPLADPFATALPGAPTAEAVAAATRAAATTTAAVAAPALPFAYLGRWREQGRSWVFLSRDGQTHRIAGPGPLDAEYAVQAIDEQRIDLVYLPLGLVQTLSLDQPAPAPGSEPAARAGAATGSPAAPVAAAGSDSPPPVEEN